MATRKTVIRNEERRHEVKLGQGDQLAQSAKAEVQAMDIPPPLVRKRASASTRSAAKDTPAATPAAAPAPAAARKKARLGDGAASPSSRKSAPKPRLPARVPADRLWEDNSVVMQRLQALQEHNARLTEQLQRLQSPASLKGFQP